MPHLSPFVRSSDHLFLSGQLAFDAEHGFAPDIAGQTEQCLANIAETLAGEGLTLHDIVKTTVFLTSAGDFPAFDASYARIFGDHRPARSTVIAGLAIAGALIEIEVIAAARTSL